MPSNDINGRNDNNLISCELSILLKNFGFDLPCMHFFDTEMHYQWRSAYPINHNLKNNEISQPYYSQVIDWLRDSQGIYIALLPLLDEHLSHDKYSFETIAIDTKNVSKYSIVIESSDFKSALAFSIQWILEKIKR